MQVVILAGGMGTRIQSVAGDLPKALIPVAGKPFVLHQLELLKRNGLNEILMLIGYRGEMIQELLGDGSAWNMHVDYVTEDPSALLGTGGALIHAKDKLAPEFMLMYGDSYLPVKYQAMLEWYRSRAVRAVMSVFRNHGQWDSSNVRINGDNVVYYNKKAKPGDADYIDYGLSIFRRDVLEAYLNHAPPLDLAVILSDLVQAGQLAAYEVNERFYEIGQPEGWRELDKMLSGADQH